MSSKLILITFIHFVFKSALNLQNIFIRLSVFQFGIHQITVNLIADIGYNECLNYFYLVAPDTKSIMPQSEWFSRELGENILLPTYIVFLNSVFSSCHGVVHNLLAVYLEVVYMLFAVA